MELRYTVHLDDYHSNIVAPGFRTVEGAAAQVRGELDNGYDVDRITLDGQPFCRHGSVGSCQTCKDARAYRRLGTHAGD